LDFTKGNLSQGVEGGEWEEGISSPANYGVWESIVSSPSGVRGQKQFKCVRMPMLIVFSQNNVCYFKGKRVTMLKVALHIFPFWTPQSTLSHLDSTFWLVSMLKQ